MSFASQNFLLHGSDSPLFSPRKLRAGPLSLDYENGDIRAVKLGSREIIRRIYGAVRDRNWFTVPFEITGFQERVSENEFYLSFTCEHRFGEIEFRWRGEIAGNQDGSIRFTFDGESQSTFLRNRIGLCVLHPIRECAGAKCRALYRDGSVADLVFPNSVAAEQPLNGFRDLAGLAHEVVPGLWAELRFYGDVFETEDQRNWIDASFKTFSTPITSPRPVEVKAGTRIQQSIEFRFYPGANLCFRTSMGLARVNFPSCLAVRASDVFLNVTKITSRIPLPKIGLEVTDAPLITEIERKRLAALKLQHLRAEIKPPDKNWRAQLNRAAQLANELAVPLELSIHLPEDVARGQLDELREAVAQIREQTLRIFALQTGECSTTAAALQLFRGTLGDLGIPIGGGSDADLYQLQLQPPPSESDFIFWSMNPQVHASDDRSIMETPEAAPQQVASMARRFSTKPLVVSPITLKPRFNPVGAAPEPTPPPGELPAAVDPRQMSLFCAAWTVAMLADLAPSGVESMTFFKTAGGQGVMEAVPASYLQERFPSVPGCVFPAWHVFAALSGYKTVATFGRIEPREIAALMVINGANRQRLLLANVTSSRVTVRMESCAGAGRVLDEANIFDAMCEPERWWYNQGEPLPAVLELRPYAVGFFDLA